MLSLIVALTRQQVIGKNQQLPWHLPADLAHFKAKTLGQTVVMGRKTLEAIGKPLPQRENWVLSRQLPSAAQRAAFPGVTWLSDPNLLLQLKKPLWIIGGAEIFAWALPYASALEVTWVEAEVMGDTFFPLVDWAAWQLAKRFTRQADAKNIYDLTFETWYRLD
jgi:dihydrofolate reductase